MAKQTIKDKEVARQESIEQTVSKTEQFYNENKKAIWGCVIAVVVIGLGILAYHRFIYEPKCAEAMEQTYPAERSFQNGEWDLALNGDGNVMGFTQIIDEYGAKAGKAVYFYAGVCELQLGNWESAISYLKKYKGKDSILAARALACMGDAYVGLEDYKSAVPCFEKAASRADNIFAAAYLLKAGVTREELGDKAGALACYEKIKDQYPQSIEGYDIDKYISRVK
ncbi:MAG: tetratricopeptide repeat protein [Bacteroidales bacterium]|nr:tetratricopeptide repeat protein [Bacteroidales bacterium]